MSAAPRVVAGHRIRPFLLAVSLAALVSTIGSAVALGGSGWWIALGLTAPDVLPLVGFRTPTEAGRMPRTMVPLYNATHAIPGPLALLGLAVVIGSVDLGLVGAAWLTHILWDRGVGYDLRARDGSFRRSGTNRSRLEATADVA